MSDKAELNIVDLLRVGDPQSKQILTVRIQLRSEECTLPPNTGLVTKIYDPLRFDYEQDGTDPFLFVEEEYSREAAVYNALSDLQGTLIPKYYGSFSFSIPFPAGSDIDGFREVQLIPIELIGGTPMDNLDPGDFNQSQRQLILKLVVDIESLLYERHIINKDSHPRNFIIREGGLSVWKIKPSKTAPSIVLIDFGRCGIGRALTPEREQARLPGDWISPLLRWVPEPRGKLNDWFDWDWKT